MPYCPVCGGEFVAGVSLCPDCEVPLAAAPPEPDGAALDDLTERPAWPVVLESGDPAALAVARSLLDGAGIAHRTEGEGLQDLVGVGRLGTGFSVLFGPVRLRVPPDREAAARALLSDLGPADDRDDPAEHRAGAIGEAGAPDEMPPPPAAEAAPPAARPAEAGAPDEMPPPPAAEAAPPAVRPAKAGAWGRFLVGLGVGVVIGSLAPRPVEREEGSEPRPAARRNAVVSEDVDGDGKDDTWTTYRDGRAVGSVQDIDGDGRSDLWNEFDSRGAVSVQRADTDFDGRVDSWATFRGLRTVSASQDRNRDGRPDRWTRYDAAGQASSEDEDNDFDGEPDAWYTYRAAQLVEGREDTDFDGTADVLLRYRHSLLVEAVWEPRPGAPGRMVVYRHGQRHEELRDLDGDGDYDLRIAFDPFESPMEQVEIR